MGGGVDPPTLMSYLEDAIREFPDSRTGSNTRYQMRDAALAAFSVFFTQSPSFLSHQRLMQLRKGRSNAGTVFGVDEIPTDNHIRSLLYPVSVSPHDNLLDKRRLRPTSQPAALKRFRLPCHSAPFRTDWELPAED